MNKNERRRLTAAAQKYCSITMQALEEFRTVTDSLKDREQEKLENLPESLRDSSSQSINITEAVDQLEELEEYFESIEESCNEIAGLIHVGIEYHTVNGNTSRKDNDPRRNRLQILVTDHMLDLIRLRASAEGCSQNELINRALTNELEEQERR